MSDEYVSISLEELVLRSGYILIVKELNPFRVPHIMTRDGYEPFETFILNYLVEEVLYPLDADIAGDKVEILPADVGYKYQLHRESQSGLHTMAIFDVYESKTDFGSEQPYMVFLKKTWGGYEFAVDGAYESIDFRQKVCRIIKEREHERQQVELPAAPTFTNR